MAIRIRKSNNLTIAVCAAETDPVEGDLYLDDASHYALTAKFAQDWQGQTLNTTYEEEWHEMEKTSTKGC